MPNLKRTALFIVIAVALLAPAALVTTFLTSPGFTPGGSSSAQLWWLMNVALFPLFWLHRETKRSARLLIWLVAVSLGVISMFAAQRIGIALFVQDVTGLKYALHIATVSWFLADVVAFFVAIRLIQRLKKSVKQEH
jgi:hypothetical protein